MLDEGIEYLTAASRRIQYFASQVEENIDISAINFEQ